MKILKKCLFLLGVIIHLQVNAEMINKKSAPYDGIKGLQETLLNGQIQQLMPPFCAFFQPGQGGGCDIYFVNAEKSLMPGGGGAKQGYCENMQLSLGEYGPCAYNNIPPGLTLQQCNQQSQQLRTDTENLIAQYCSN